MINLRDMALGKKNNVSTAPYNSRNLSRDQRRHDLKSLVAQFESMATKLWSLWLISTMIFRKSISFRLYAKKYEDSLNLNFFLKLSYMLTVRS